MLMQLLGIMDVLIALIILAKPVVTKLTLFIAAAYLIIKGLIFVLTDDLASYADVAIGIYIILVAFNLSFGLLTVIAVVFLMQKGAMSFG